MERQKLNEIQAVVFDLDGLMFDSERYVQKSWDLAGEAMGYGPLGHNIEHTLGLNVQNREKYFKKNYGEEFPFEKFLDTYRAAYQKLIKKEQVPVKKGLYELLDLLKKYKIRRAVATSSSGQYVHSNLERVHISQSFDVVITGDMVEHGKPAPDIYEKACEQLQIHPSKAIALEDAPNGIESAYKAGLMPVMIPDLVRDTKKVDWMLAGTYDSLLDFARVLQEVFDGKEA